MSVGVTEALFVRSEKVLVLKQKLMMSVRGSARKLLAVLVNFGGISSSPMALVMLMHFISFNAFVVVTAEKENHLASLECFFLYLIHLGDVCILLE